MTDQFVVRGCRVAAVLWLSAGAAVAQAPVALVNVNVVPMDSERVVLRQTVLVEAGRIVRIGPAGEAPIPAGVRVVDGGGAFLMPGLADMHVHLLGDSNELALYVANGVTTIRDLSGEPEYFNWRQQVAEGRRVGPNILVASPLIDAPSGRRWVAWSWGWAIGIAALLFAMLWWPARRIRPAWLRLTVGAGGAAAAIGGGYLLTRTLVPFPDRLAPDGAVPHWRVGSTSEAAAAVRSAAGVYDLVKLYEHLSPAQFAAAVHAARQAGIHTVAHVPVSLGLIGTLQSGVDELAHLYFLVVELQSSTDTSSGQTAEQRDASYARRLHGIVADVRRSGVDVTSTLMPMPELLELWTDTSAFRARDDLRYRTAAMRQSLGERLGHPPSAAEVADVRMHLVWGKVAARELVATGVPLVLGTDNSPMTAVAGFGVHHELQLLTTSGLTPFQALRAATVNAGRVAGASSNWGTIAVGMRADLVLATGNPLADPATLRTPRGVMVAGRWYGRAALDSLLADVVQRRAGSEASPSSRR